MPGSTRAADLALVSVTAIWGSTFVVNELVLKDTPPLVFLALRFALGGLVLLALSRGRARTPRLHADGAVLGALLAGGIGLQLTGQIFTTASKTAFITGLSVPLTPLVAWLLVRKLPTASNAIGLGIAVAGFTVLSWPREATGLEVGDVLVFGTAVLYAGIIVLLSEWAPRHDPRLFAASQTLWAAAFVGAARLALIPFLGGGGAFLAAEARPVPMTPKLALAVLWMALAATVLTFAVQTWAQARVSATRAALIFALEPVWTSLFAAAVLGERLGGRELAGASLVLAGIVASELPFFRR